MQISWDQDEVSKVKKELSSGGRQQLPDGEYVVRIVESAIDIEKGYPRISTKLSVSDGEYKGRYMWANYNLSDKAKYIFAKEMLKLNLDVAVCTSIDILQAMMNSLEGKEISVFKKTNPSKTDPSKSYQNIYINGFCDNGPKAPGLDTSEDLAF
jgi:hypothetical protein